MGTEKKAVTGTEILWARGQACDRWALPTLDQLFLSAQSAVSPPTRPTHRPMRVERVRARVGLPFTSAQRPWEGWGGATHACLAAAPRPMLKCASAQVRKVAQAGAREDGRFKDGIIGRFGYSLFSGH